MLKYENSDLVAVLGAEDTQYAIERLARFGKMSLMIAEEFLEDMLMNWGLHQGDCTVDALLLQASDELVGIAEWEERQRDDSY